jgi:hypothetical protein
MRRSSIYEVPEEIRSRIELLWQEGGSSLDDLVSIAGGGISRSGLHRYFKAQVSGQAYVRRISAALLRRIADTLRTPSVELGVIDLVRLCEGVRNLDEIVNRSVTPKRKGARWMDRRRQKSPRGEVAGVE